MRELVEMRYLFEEPFVVDSSKIAAKLGVHAACSRRVRPVPAIDASS